MQRIVANLLKSSHADDISILTLLEEFLPHKEEQQFRPATEPNTADFPAKTAVRTMVTLAGGKQK